MLRTHLEHPISPSGYRVYAPDAWRVVVPSASTNLILNPSFETNTTGYTATGGATAIARVSTHQKRGVYALEITPAAAADAGAYYTTAILVSGRDYCFSVDVLGKRGVAYTISCQTNAGVSLSRSLTFVAKGVWERVYLSFTETGSATRRLVLTRDSSSDTTIFYTDGWKLRENSLKPDTYHDGDSIGFINAQISYYWTGTPHASSSVRILNTRSGGEEMSLSRYGFTVLAILGLGLGPVANISTPLALVGGAQYQRTVSLDRTFQIVGSFDTDSHANLQRLRGRLVDAVRYDRTATQQPLLLTYHEHDDCGQETGNVYEIPCVFDGQLGEMDDNHHQTRTALAFHIYLPYVASAVGNAGAVMAYQQTLPSGTLFWRDTGGVWAPMGNVSLGNDVYAKGVLALPDGTYLIPGEFLNASGDANADFLARYDPGTDAFTAFNATPLNQAVYGAVLMPDQNTVLLVGNFTNAGGDANADYACFLNLTTGAFSAINATPLSANVGDAAVLPNGDVLIAGNFDNAGGDANADKFIKLVGTTYTALNTTPLNGRVNRVVILPNGDAFFVGSFTQAGADTTILRAGYLTISTGLYTAPSPIPLGATGETIAVGLDGKVYIGETTIYSWLGPGSPFVELDDGVNNFVFSISVQADGTILLGGSFTEAGGISTPGPIAGWNGSSFFPGEIVLASAETPRIKVTPDGHLVVAPNNAVTGPFAVVTTVTNNGSQAAFPKITFTGPGAVYQVKNYTTGDTLYFNLTLNAGEIAVLTLSPGNISFVSNFRGNILSSILDGSNRSTWRLLPGENAISVFVAGTTSAATAVTMQWKECYWSLDGVRQ